MGSPAASPARCPPYGPQPASALHSLSTSLNCGAGNVEGHQDLMHRRAAHDLALPGFLSTPVASFLSRPAAASKKFPSTPPPVRCTATKRVVTGLPPLLAAARHLRRRCARLRPSNGAAGSVVELPRLVERIHWPKTKIVVRDGSGFCRDDIMT